MKLITFLFLQLIAMTATAQLKPITSGVYHWNELPVKKDVQREFRSIMEGTTNEFSYFEVHATTQEKGATPKPPHAQTDIEELMIIKEGKMKATIGNKVSILGAGSVLLIAPGDMQTFENVGDGPLTYYVFQFRSRNGVDMERNNKAGGSLLLNADSLPFKESTKGAGKKYFDRPTATCSNYEIHITQLNKKGPSHAPHTHVDTEIILVIDGEAEMTIDGKDYKASAGDMIIAESGKLHGVGNATEKPCSYFAFKWR
jgi:quercetin dioxygenase-like cupin family protein